MHNDKLEEAAKQHVVDNETINETKTSIGPPIDINKPIVADSIGFKTIPLENLPSQGIFYPRGTQIAIRAAVYKEIRHWSTIDETDMLNLNDMLNYVIERCVQIKIPGQMATYRDIKEIDRFYIVFAISEYTSIEGKQKAQAKIELNNGETKLIPLSKEMLKIFDLPEELKKYIDAESNSLKFTFDMGEVVNMTLPSIGVIERLQNIRVKLQQKGVDMDDDFVLYAPFVIENYKELSDNSYQSEVEKSLTWSLEKISLVPNVTEILANGVDPVIEFIDEGGNEVTTPLNFHGGAKSLFLISDIFDRLV